MIELLEFTVTKKIPLVIFLREKILERFPNVSNSKIRRLIASGQVYINGQQCRVPSAVVRHGDRMRIKIDSEKFLAEKKTRDIDFTLTAHDVLYEDEAIIVVNKPAFFPTEQTITGNRKNLHDEVVQYLWQKNQHLRNPPYAGIMHRLDKDTSGAILFTKKREINKAIFKMFEKRIIEKTYRAVTASPQKPLPDKFTVENYLERQTSKTQAAKWHSVKNVCTHQMPQMLRRQSEKMAKTGTALFARTDFRILQSGTFLGSDALFIEAKPRTGRTHQIRVHLSEYGAAIFGDTIYGGEDAPRLMLHAFSLQFAHPITHEKLKIEAPLPQQFQ